MHIQKSILISKFTLCCPDENAIPYLIKYKLTQDLKHSVKIKKNKISLILKKLMCVMTIL